MKKIYIFILIVLFLIAGKRASAITPPPNATSVPTPIKSEPTVTQDITGVDQQINGLKERIASRVAQLKLVEKRGIIGKVSDISQTQLILSNDDNTNRIVDVDELTQFSSPSAKTGFGISDIKKDSVVGVTGLYNKDSKRILARFVDVLSLPKVFSGAILKIDKENFSLNITTENQEDFSVDVSSITKTYSYTKADGLLRSGFSKLRTGERVFIVGFFDVNNNKNIIASRVIRLPLLSVNPAITLHNPQNFGVTTSTGSGVKLVPIINNQK